jgi:hypothetical protein
MDAKGNKASLSLLGLLLQVFVVPLCLLGLLVGLLVGFLFATSLCLTIVGNWWNVSLATHLIEDLRVCGVGLACGVMTAWFSWLLFVSAQRASRAWRPRRLARGMLVASSLRGGFHPLTNTGLSAGEKAHEEVVLHVPVSSSFQH